MQLIRTLLIAATIVVILSGISVFFGSPKQEKKTAIFFLLSAIGASIWTIAIAIFMHMPGVSDNFIHAIVTCIITGVTLCDVGLLGFLSWNYKGGKQLTFIFALAGTVLVTLLAVNPNLFYSSVDITKDYSQLFINYSWYYFTLIVYFFLISIVFSGYLKKRIKETTNTVLFESAKFARDNIRRTSRSVGKSSDSSARYAKGVDEYATGMAMKRAESLWKQR